MLLKLITELTLHEDAFIEAPYHFNPQVQMRRERFREKLLELDAKLIMQVYTPLVPTNTF